MSGMSKSLMVQFPKPKSFISKTHLNTCTSYDHILWNLCVYMHFIHLSVDCHFQNFSSLLVLTNEKGLEWVTDKC